MERVEKLNAVQNQELKADAVEDELQEVLSSYEVDSAFKNVFFKSSEGEIQSEAVLENLYSIETSNNFNHEQNGIIQSSKQEMTLTDINSKMKGPAVKLEMMNNTSVGGSYLSREAKSCKAIIFNFNLFIYIFTHIS